MFFHAMHWFLLIFLMVSFPLFANEGKSQGSSKKKRRFMVDQVVAIVNDEAITQTDLQRSLFPLLKQLRASYRGVELREKMNQAANKVLNQLIDNKLILQTAKKLNEEEELVLSEKEILRYMEKIISQFPSREVFNETLKRENLSFEDFKKDSREQLLVKHLVARKVSAKIMVSNLDIKEYYESHISEFKKPAKISFHQIMLYLNEKDDSEKRKLIQELREKAVNGEDFKSLAIEFSEGAHAKDGGFWKDREKGEFTKELEKAIWELKPGEVSQVVETGVSLHLVKVLMIEKERIVPLEDLWSQIQNKIYVERAENIRKEWLKELRKNAYLQIFNDAFAN